MKSVPRCITTEETNSENFDSDHLGGNRKRKAASERSKKNNKNNKFQESTNNSEKTHVVPKTEVNDRLYEKSKNTANVITKICS